VFSLVNIFPVDVASTKSDRGAVHIRLLHLQVLMSSLFIYELRMSHLLLLLEISLRELTIFVHLLLL